MPTIAITPCRPRRPPPLRARPSAMADDEASGSTPIRLLVVDDDLNAIEHLGHLLKGFAQVSFATNGEDALRLALQQRPDLVLLDIELPGVDGFEVCRRMRAMPALHDLPIVFATRHGDAGTEAQARRTGGDDFLRKPFDDVQVLARLRLQLRAGAAHAEDLVAVAPQASMLSYLAHEIGNPVNVIKGFAQLMQAGPLQAGQAEKLSHILEAVERLRGLLDDMTDVARMESGQFHVETAEVELNSFLQQACMPAQAQAAQAGVHLHLPTPAWPVRVRADARRLRQCLDNLLSNALKYGDDGGRIDIEIEDRGGEVVLAVQDQGVGFSDSQMAQLFEPYNRLGRDGGAIPGTGLGLTLTRELMRAMGGRLLVHSDGTGHGARFELLLRAAD
ncbi:ATP-binding protein [Roseateles sp. BYS78W]|uniref:histidine kinase n=1 Tax=Pelomonas candidula TaxID=3299025 RepID=A0ABW7HE68_9BURK